MGSDADLRTVTRHGKLTRLAVLAYLVGIFVVYPSASVPPLIERFGIVAALDGVKLIVLVAAILAGWVAVLSACRTSGMVAIMRFVVWGDFRSISSVVIATLSLGSWFTPQEAGVALLGASARLDGALLWAMMLHSAQLAYAVTRLGLVSLTRVTVIALTGAAVASLYLSADFVSIDLWTVSVGEFVGRKPRAALGNTGLASIYLATMYCTGVAALLVTTRGKRWRTFLIAALAITAVGLGLTAGRAGVIAAFAVLVLLTGIGWRMRRGRGWLTPLTAMAGLLLVLAVSAATTSFGAERVSRFTVPATQDANVTVRFLSWELGAKAMLVNPWFGSGPGAFADLVWQRATPEQERDLIALLAPDAAPADVSREGRAIAYVHPSTGQLEFGNINFDKAHNYLIDAGIQFGLIGLALIIAWWAFVVLIAWRNRMRQPSLLMASLVYIIAMQAWFHTPMIDPPVFAFIGAAMGTVWSGLGDEQLNDEPQKQGA